MTDWILVASGVAVVGCGMVAGLFLTFSDFVMRSLALAQVNAGVEVMQIINREIWRSVTMALLWGMVGLTAGLGLYGGFLLSGPSSVLLSVGGATYFSGMLMISFLFNIPMNNKLDQMNYSGAPAAIYWKAYVPGWVFWNYIRAIASAGSAVCFLLACFWGV